MILEKGDLTSSLDSFLSALRSFSVVPSGSSGSISLTLVQSVGRSPRWMDTRPAGQHRPVGSDGAVTRALTTLRGPAGKNAPLYPTLSEAQ